MTPSSILDIAAARGGISQDSIFRWLQSLNRLLRPADGWISVLLLALNLMTVVWSVERADWVPTPSLVSLILLAMLTGLALSRLPIWGILLLPVGLAIGALVIVGQLISFEAENVRLVDAADLWTRLSLWFEAARSGSISIDIIPFAFGIMVATWLSGYLAAWVFFRLHNFWGVFILGGAGLLSNLTYLPPNPGSFMLVYLFTALLLIARVRSVRRRREWSQQGFQFDGHLGILSLSDSAFLAIVVLLVAFLLPVGRHVEPAHSIYEVMRSPLVSYEGDFNRLFAGLPARRPLPYRIWGDVMAFQGTINPTTTPVLQVNSEVPVYWKARTYGLYTPKGWVSDDTVFKPPDWVPTHSASLPYLSRFDAQYSVTPNYSSKSLFAGAQVVGASKDVRVETYDSPVYTLDFTDPGSLQGLPPRLAEATAGLDRVFQERGRMAGDAILAQALPGEFVLEEVSRDLGEARQARLAEVIPAQPDTLSIRSAGGSVKRGETYHITSSVSVATPTQLRGAGVDYPTWALTRYTQLPADLPQRVSDLAARLTAGAQNPYDKARAIEGYLETFTYSLEVDPPPYNADGVDHFLFTLKRGYSEYFASSMTVMLRTQGIPARLATGYTVGDKVPDQDIYIVNDSHSHAWLEVFFPRYGWIPFEPTPGARLPIAQVPSARGADFPALPASGDLTALDCDDELDEEDCGGDGNVPLADGANSGIDSLSYRLRQGLPWILAVLIAVGLTGGLSWLWWRRYMAPSADPDGAFRHLAMLGALASVGPAAYQTPFQYRQRLEEAFPNHRSQLSVIVDTYVRSLYGKKEVSEEERHRLVEAWLRLRFPLLLHVFRRRNP